MRVRHPPELRDRVAHRLLRAEEHPVSPEVVLIATLPQKSTGVYALVQLRGVSERALEVRETVKIARGRYFRPGIAEVVAETLVAEVSERGATRMDDKTSDASMEKRKKDGYF